MMRTPLAAAIWTAAMLICMSLQSSYSGSLHPVILVPGSGGNQLEARLTEKYKPSSWVCSRRLPWRNEGWFRLWFDVSVLLGPFTKCFAERMTLHYDAEKDDYFNAPGVETRVPQFGSVESLLYLDPHLKQVTAYMAPLVESLQQIGYIKDESLFGAPYDFRYGLAAPGRPSAVGSKYLKDLKTLIETASSANGGKPVILVSHSLGGLFVLELLNRNPKPWRQKFIKHFIAISAPWGGAVDATLTLASGNALGVPLVDPLLVRAEQRSSESNLWLLPNPTVFVSSKPLVVGPNRSYTSSEIVGFLRDIGFPEGVKPYEDRIAPLVKAMFRAPPEVPVTCIVGTGVKTMETLFYGKELGFDGRPEVVYGDGDGTVNIESLLALETLWKEEKNQTLKVIKLNGMSHTSVLSDKTALEKIIEEVSYVNCQSMDFHFIENINQFI